MRITCDFCQKEFYKQDKKISKCKTHFCSRKCHGDYVKKHSSKTKEKCSYCGKDVFRNNAQKRNSKTGLYFCNHTCGNRFLAEQSKTHINPYSHQRRKKRIFEKAKNKCQKCGYNDNKKMLDVHHNDGDHHNNKWDNLRCICSWCHTKHHRDVEKIDFLPPLFNNDAEEMIFTKKNRRYRRPPRRSEVNPNWRNSPRPNTRKVERPTKEVLKQLILEKPFEQIGRDYNVSGNAVRGWCKHYDINTKIYGRGYWAKKKANKI